MSDYQKVEVGRGEEDGPFSEEDVQQLQAESDTQDADQEERVAVEEEREDEILDEERPEWLPEKFGTPEDLAKAYSDLEAQYTQAQQGEDGETLPERDSVRSLDDLTAFNQEFAETGDISEESRAKVESEWGLPREMIDGYIEGQKAILSAHFNTIYSEVGGEDNYGEMIEWAKSSIPEGEQGAFNEAVVNGTTDQMMFAVRSLAGRWQTATGAMTPGAPLIQGDTGYTGASGGFRSTAELTQAMKDPRYTRDPAYRKDIENRLANSNIL